MITLTDAAAERILEIIHKRGDACHGVRIGVKFGGCTGLVYTFEYVKDEIKDGEQVIHDKGVTIYMDQRTLLYLAGTQVNYIEQEMQSCFTFTNPNAKRTCGCGKSFS